MEGIKYHDDTFLSSLRTMIYVFVCHKNVFLFFVFTYCVLCLSSFIVMLFDFMFSGTNIYVLFSQFITHSIQQKSKGEFDFFFVHHVIYSSSSSAMLLFQFMYLGNWIMFQYNNCRHLNGKKYIQSDPDIMGQAIYFYIEKVEQS